MDNDNEKMELRKATDYEKSEYNSIQKWENEPPNIVNQALGVVSTPAVWLAQKLVPQKAIEGCLNLANAAGSALADTRDILRDGGVAKISDLKNGKLEVCDKIANSVHNWALAFATAEGCAAGFFGLAGMAVDIPVLITFSLRSIHKVGLCYGYESISGDDERFILNVLSAAGANNPTEKMAAITTMRSIQQMIMKTTWKKMAETAAQKTFGKEAGVMAVKNLAKQLGINITKRKALQAIPCIGAGIGATMNAQYINDICWAARRSFQKRWLDENCVEIK
ncbi:EcsC protein family protein [Fibrobacter intestinalis]|uniref:EcsC protein family protein n=1 Tax=Fibrobacter intestinalis TaxID=28122 RepID=A0A1M6TA27_9BACT|nr:EcsC family protein [Fibrobacter intestinalis]SHK53811.1 EcsC protein family protein [Fibrobacter intestinalis]